MILRLRRVLTTAVCTAAVVVAGGGLAGPAHAMPQPGTDPVSTSPSQQGVIVQDVRVGHHDGFDRLVFELSPGVPDHLVRYQDEITNDPTGEPVILEGDASVLVVIRGTDWLNHQAPQDTITPRFPMLRQVKGAGEFEGDASYGVGLASASGFRVFELSNPARLVIDFTIP